MPYIESDDGSVLDLAAAEHAAQNQKVHELVFNVQNVTVVSVEVALYGDGSAFSGTTISVLRSVTGNTQHAAEFASAVNFTAAGAVFDIPVSGVPYLVVRNVSPSGSGRAVVKVWGEYLGGV